MGKRLYRRLSTPSTGTEVCATTYPKTKIPRIHSAWRDQSLWHIHSFLWWNVEQVRYVWVKTEMRAETCVNVHVNLPLLMLIFNQNLSVQTDFSKFPTLKVRKEISDVQNFILFFLSQIERRIQKLQQAFLKAEKTSMDVKCTCV
jgi:hypothetical protein